MKEHRKIRYTKQALSDSLIQLLHKKPLAKISITELCETADINRTTFYAHYRDLMDLFNDIETNFINYMNQMLDQVAFNQPNQSTITLIHIMLDFLMAHKSDVEILLGDSETVLFQEKVITSIYERAGIKEPNLKTNESIKYMYIIHGSIALIKAWVSEGFKTSTESLAKNIYKLALSVLHKSQI